jgi:hypothetical protein
MKRSALLVSLLVIALVAFASVASAQQASVFGNGVLVRAFISYLCTDDPSVTCFTDAECGAVGGTCNTSADYSASLEVRDETGDILPISDFTVTPDLGTMTPVVAKNPFLIHQHDLVNNDITLSFDSLTNRIYVFCTNEAHGLHVMTYNISLNTPVNGACVTYSQGLTQEPTNLCAVGTASEVSGTGPWSWTCYGANGGQNASCTAQKKVDGVCGSSNGQTLTSAPTSNLCSAGTPTTVSGSGPWNWTCTGIGTGTTATCSANIQSSGTPDIGFTMSWGQVSGVVGQSGGDNNKSFSETVTIVNTGNAPAGNFTVKAWFCGHYVLDSSCQLLYTWNVPGLAVGQTRTQVFSPMTFSGAAVHTYQYVITKVDADNQITESNEAICYYPASPTTGCNVHQYQYYIYR